MGYIIKNTSGLINTKLTDTGRLKLSQGSFNIAYFQIGDSEVSYNTLPSTYNQFDTFILEPSFNAQNSAGAPQSNKENVKYPYYVDGSAGNTYGIPYMDSSVSPVFNRAVMRGFFTGNTTGSPINWSALTNDNYAVNPNYIVKMSSLSGSNKINLIYDVCSVDAPRMPSVGDIITIYYDGNGLYNCYCEGDNPTTTTTTYIPINYSWENEFTYELTPSPTPVPTNENPCASPTPTPTPTATFCPTPTPSNVCPKPPKAECLMDIKSCYPILTYRIVDICFDTITLDRPTPDFSYLNGTCYGRAIVYPPAMIPFYDSYTPRPHWNDDVINFESVCYTDQFDVKIWNMNIPWSESPAGLYSSINKDYTQFGSIQYLGTKEYLGYASSSGQTDTSSVYYFNSLGDKITVTPEEQKAIGIVHYTNKTIDLFYGEKFALEPYEDVDDTTGQAREFRVHIPWIMWHKNPDCCHGQTFWVDPPGFDDLNLFQVQYLQSNKNVDMNTPGMRYYHLWDNHPGVDGIPNRVGKVFPDSKIIVFDDEEIIAAMSYKSNRNWTLPAPRLSLITPNTCGTDTNSVTGILSADTETLYVTYRLSNSRTFTNYLHSNYYSVIQGPNLCLPFSSQNVAVRFGPEFPCLNQPFVPPTTTTTTFNPFTTTTTTHSPFPTPTPSPTPSGGCGCWVISGLTDAPIQMTLMDEYGKTYTEVITGPIAYVCSCAAPTPTMEPVLGLFVQEIGDCKGTPECSGSSQNVCTCYTITGIDTGFEVTVTDSNGDKQIISIFGGQGSVCSCSNPTANIPSNQWVYDVAGSCDEFPCSVLLQPNLQDYSILTNTTTYSPVTTTTTFSPYTTTTTTCPIFCDQFTGFFADTFEVLVQKVPTGERPSPSEWKILDFTNQLTSTMINGFITQEGLTGNTFVITQQDYDNASYYNLNDYIPLTPVGFSGSQLNFGDEYYFYGNIETDIQATIYEMRYKINLGQSEFQSSSNPSWTPGTQSYVTEIGLYDSQKNLMIISKMQSPVVRQGIQQFLVKFDF